MGIKMWSAAFTDQLAHIKSIRTTVFLIFFILPMAFESKLSPDLDRMQPSGKDLGLFSSDGTRLIPKSFKLSLNAKYSCCFTFNSAIFHEKTVPNALYEAEKM
jgi:hypothetical protein